MSEKSPTFWVSNLTRDSDVTIVDRLVRDPDFRMAFEQEAAAQTDENVKAQLLRLLASADSKTS